MIIRSSKAGGFIRTNASFADKVGFSLKEISEKPLLDWVIIEDRALLIDLLEGKIEDCYIRHRTKDGNFIKLIARISERQESDCLILARSINAKAQRKHLGNNSEEANVKSTLHEIAHIVEAQNPGYKCSILLLEDGHFVKGAGPSLPEDYNYAIDGFAIGPTVGSCGTAIYWNIPVIVCDIQKDPLWLPFAELAKKADVHACWSHPFTSKSGRVLGALALYSPEPRTPTVEQLELLKAIAGMTGLAVERGRAEEALRIKHEQALELENQLRQAAKMEALGVLAGGIAHDFNNVMASILANSELSLLILDKFPDQEEKIEVELKLNEIITASHRAGNFCKQMLSYAGRGKAEKKQIEIGELISEIDSLVQAALSKKTVLQFDLEEKPTFVIGDENQLLQVIMNLITNAAESIGNNEGRIVLSSKVEDYTVDALEKLSPNDDLPAGPFVRLTVTDNGSGIDTETKIRLFDPFYTTKSSGRGLGLSAVKGIIKMHGGVIYLKSELSKGTSFTVLLPAVKSDDLKEIQLSIDDDSSVQKAGKRILFADDEPALLLAIPEALKHYDYDVVKAADGQEAVDLFCHSPESFDCVVMDYNMPRLNGREAAERIFAVNQAVPIILISGNSNTGINDDFDETILSASLQKPVAIGQLVETIEISITNKHK